MNLGFGQAIDLVHALQIGQFDLHHTSQCRAQSSTPSMLRDGHLAAKSSRLRQEDRQLTERLIGSARWKMHSTAKSHRGLRGGGLICGGGRWLLSSRIRGCGRCKVAGLSEMGGCRRCKVGLAERDGRLSSMESGWGRTEGGADRGVNREV